MICTAFLAALLNLVQEADPALGEKKVQVKKGNFYKGPTRTSGALRATEYGEEVVVSGVEGNYAKATAKKDGLQAWIFTSSLTPKEKFVVSAADQKEGEKLAAQGLEGQRGLNPATEKEYRSAGGADREKAYQELEALMSRPAGKDDRAALERTLQEFRQAGKLGEFSPVK